MKFLIVILLAALPSKNYYVIIIQESNGKQAIFDSIEECKLTATFNMHTIQEFGKTEAPGRRIKMVSCLDEQTVDKLQGTRI